MRNPLTRVSQKTWIITAVVLGVLAAIAGLTWFLVGHVADVWNVFVRAITRKVIVRGMFPGWNPLHWTGFTWLIITIAIGVVGVFVLYHRQRVEVRNPNHHMYRYTPEEKDLPRYTTIREWGWATSLTRRIIAGAIALLILASFVYVIFGWADNAKDEAAAYLKGTSFVIEDPNSPPESLSPLTKGAKADTGKPCVFPVKHDVSSCITQGTFTPNWEARTASLAGAQIVMGRVSGAVSNTDIMDETLTYLYPPGGGKGAWSAIRNGKNKQPAYGVVQWDGTNQPQTCKFTGEHSLNYAFGGRWGHNLNDLLAARYPGLLYDLDDAWGTCSGFGTDVTKKEPVIVIPVTTQHPYGRRTVLRAGGVLVIRGSASGEPKIEHRKTVKAGEFPGPVYPKSLVVKQREALQWAAGRGAKRNLHFGYEPADASVQGGNVSEYLLRDTTSGRIFWMTPLTTRGSKSQLLLSYSLTPADEVAGGKLNQQRVFVRPDNDPRTVNIDDMAARMNEAIRRTNSGFFGGQNPGAIEEFLPVNNTTWQAFAVLNGRVVYMITISPDSRIAPEVKSLEPQAPTQPGAKAIPVCAKQPAQMTDQELTSCLDGLSGEFKKRFAGK